MKPRTGHCQYNLRPQRAEQFLDWITTTTTTTTYQPCLAGAQYSALGKRNIHWMRTTGHSLLTEQAVLSQCPIQHQGMTGSHSKPPAGNKTNPHPSNTPSYTSNRRGCCSGARRGTEHRLKSESTWQVHVSRLGRGRGQRNWDCLAARLTSAVCHPEKTWIYFLGLLCIF